MATSAGSGPARISSSDAMWAGAGALTTALGGFLFTWVIARGVGPAGAGFIAALTAWFLVLVVVGKAGMDTALVWANARWAAQAEPAGPARLTAWASAISMSVSGLLTLVLLVLAPWVAPMVLEPLPGVDATGLVQWAAVALPAAVLTLLLLSALRGMGSARPFFLVDQIIKPGIRLVAAGVLVLLGLATVGDLSMAWLAAVPVCLAIALVFWFHARPEWGVRESSSKTALQNYALRRAPAQMLDVLNASVGVLVLSILGNAVQTGLFGVALRLVVAGQLAFTAIRLLVAPVFAQRLTQGQGSQLQAMYEGSTSFIIALSFPVYALLITSPGVVLSAFGPGFRQAWAMLVVLAVGALVQAVLGNLQTVVLMSGESGHALRATALAVFTNVAVTLGLYPLLSGLSAAVAWALAVVVEAAVLWPAVVRHGLQPATGAVLRVAVRCMVLAFPISAVAGWTWGAGAHLWSALVVSGGVVAYAAGLRSTLKAAWRSISEETVGGLPK